MQTARRRPQRWASRRKSGVPVDALEVREEGAARYVYAVVRRDGLPAAEVLADALPGLVSGLRFGKTMRWNASGVAFSRPVRWLVALLGDRVLPFAYAGLTSDRGTFGSRPAGSPALQVAAAAAYRPLMAEQAIIVDRGHDVPKLRGRLQRWLSGWAARRPMTRPCSTR